VKKQLCQGINFKIEMPRVDNQTTEDLTPDQLESLLDAIGSSTDIQATAFTKMALFTGIRRGELMKP
jgi:integrase